MVDLLAALQRSVDSSRRDRSGTGGRRSRSKSGGDRNARKRSAEDLSGMRKADLDARARELGIKGRSKMTRDELQHAVAAASNEQPSGRRAAS